MTDFTRDELALLLNLVRRVDDDSRRKLEFLATARMSQSERAARLARRVMQRSISQGAIEKLTERLDALGPLPGLEG